MYHRRDGVGKRAERHPVGLQVGPKKRLMG